LTRDQTKPNAKELLELGSNITLQQCDITSKSSLTAVLKDCYGFFAMTNYFEHRLKKEEDNAEVKDGKQMADVAKEVGVTHYIWSHVALFDGKDEVKKYVETLGFPITSFVAPSGYYQNQMGPNNPILVKHTTWQRRS
jgi:NmrA-like family